MRAIGAQHLGEVGGFGVFEHALDEIPIAEREKAVVCNDMLERGLAAR